jgi:hypothetical protein
VASVLRGSGEEVMRMRRKLRRPRPRRFAKNVMWGLDWTYVPGVDGQRTPILGAIDCGARTCLELATVESKRTVTLPRHLFVLFEISAARRLSVPTTRRRTDPGSSERCAAGLLGSGRAGAPLSERRASAGARR